MSEILLENPPLKVGQDLTRPPSRRSVYTSVLLDAPCPKQTVLYHVPIRGPMPRPMGDGLYTVDWREWQQQQAREVQHNPVPGMTLFVVGPDDALIEADGMECFDQGAGESQMSGFLTARYGEERSVVELLSHLQGRHPGEISLTRALSTVFPEWSVREQPGFSDRFATIAPFEGGGDESGGDVTEDMLDAWLGVWADPNMTSIDAFKPPRDVGSTVRRHIDYHDKVSWGMLYMILTAGPKFGAIDAHGPILRLISRNPASDSWSVELFGSSWVAGDLSEEFKGPDAFARSHAVLEAARVIPDEDGGD